MVMSWNVGGKGIRKSGMALQDLGERMSVIELQELKIDADQLDWLKRWFKTTMPEHTAFINIKKSARAGQQSTGIMTLVHEQLTKGIKLVRHRIRGRLTTIEYANQLSGRDLVIKNVYMPAGSKAKDKAVRAKVTKQVFRGDKPSVTGGDWNVLWGRQTRGKKRVTGSRDRAFKKTVPDE
eukprot:67239-Rhodomonas_salina.4